MIEDVNLAIRQGLKLELVSHMEYRRSFFGFYADVEVAIGGLKTRHSIFVVKASDHNLVLSQFFLNLIKFSQEYQPNKIFSTITHLQTHQIVIFCTLSLQDPENQRENQIFSRFLNKIDGVYRV